MTACGVCLVVLAVVVWSWAIRGEHSVRVADGDDGHNDARNMLRFY